MSDSTSEDEQHIEDCNGEDDAMDEIEIINEEDVQEIILLEDCLVEEEEEEGDNHSENECDESLPIRDDAEFVFKKHSGQVFSCALDPKNGNIAVTGGQDDKAYVWEIHSGEVLFESSHVDSVTWVSFSYDGSYLATGDMAGHINVWKMSTRTRVWHDEVSDLLWMQWHQSSNVLLCGVVDGEVYMWRIPSGECKVIPSHSASVDCGVIMPDGRRVAIGYSDGAVKVFELKSGTVQGTSSAGEAHSTSVICIDAFSDNNIIATGGEDCKIILYKTQHFKVLWTFCCTQRDENNPCVESVKFSKDPSLPLLAAATLSGDIYILDFGKQVVRHKCELDCPVIELIWDYHSPVLYAGSRKGAVWIYDGRNGNLLAELLGHKNSIMGMCLSRDGNTLLSVSDDRTGRVYAISPPER